MGATYKNNLELTIFGESHGKAIGITIGNLPSGIQIDLDEVARDMKRRAPGQNKMSTARKEADQVEILSGLQEMRMCRRMMMRNMMRISESV